MREIQISINAATDWQTIQPAIERTIAAAGLRITLRTTLKKFPGCVHWHVKNGQLAGTLEVTYWQKSGRAWFTVQDGRNAEWIEQKIPSLSANIQRLVC